MPPFGISGTASCANTPVGQCIVSFFGQQFSEPNYLVMDTDYETYSMVYSCQPNDMAYLWILSRTPTMDPALLAHLNAQAAASLPNYDWNTAILDKQGKGCKYPSSSQNGGIPAFFLN